MNELSRMMENKKNWYALLLCIAKNVTANEALIDMGISPEYKEAENA